MPTQNDSAPPAPGWTPPERKPWVPPRLDRSGSILDDVRQTKQGTPEPGGQSPATSIQS